MIHISSTNRGSKRIDKDFYATPIPVIRDFLQHYKIKEGNILEPTAGNGNIVKTIRECGYYNHITAVELRNIEKQTLKDSGASEVYIKDFLNFIPTREYKTIITNPPFSIARNVIEKCFEIASVDTEIIMLLRIGFHGTQHRYDFWQEHPLDKQWTLACRPSFTGGGNDSSEYAWFIWDNSGIKEIKTIWGRKE